jgi:hypothetical protein
MPKRVAAPLAFGRKLTVHDVFGVEPNIYRCDWRETRVLFPPSRNPSLQSAVERDLEMGETWVVRDSDFYLECIVFQVG